MEEGPTSVGAYVPDLPGCVAVAESREEVLKLIHEAIALHLAAFRVRDSYDFPSDAELRHCADGIFQKLED